MKEPCLVGRVNHMGAHLPGAVSLSLPLPLLLYFFFSAIFIALNFSCLFARRSEAVANGNRGLQP